MSLLMRSMTWLAGCLPAMALAAGPQLKLPAFEQLRGIATESVNISIGPGTLRLAAGLVDFDNDPGDVEFKQLLHSLKGIYIRSFEFTGDNLYPGDEIEAVRAQLSAPDWSPVAQLRSRPDGEKVDIFVCMSHEKVSGLVLLASGRREFTIINVVGSIDLQQLATVERRFGVADLAR